MASGSKEIAIMSISTSSNSIIVVGIIIIIIAIYVYIIQQIRNDTADVLIVGQDL